jgi:hypothetical protein
MIVFLSRYGCDCAFGDKSLDVITPVLDGCAHFQVHGATPLGSPVVQRRHGDTKRPCCLISAEECAH